MKVLVKNINTGTDDKLNNSFAVMKPGFKSNYSIISVRIASIYKGFQLV